MIEEEERERERATENQERIEDEREGRTTDVNVNNTGMVWWRWLRLHVFRLGKRRDPDPSRDQGGRDLRQRMAFVRGHLRIRSLHADGRVAFTCSSSALLPLLSILHRPSPFSILLYKAHTMLYKVFLKGEFADCVPLGSGSAINPNRLFICRCYTQSLREYLGLNCQVAKSSKSVYLLSKMAGSRVVYGAEKYHFSNKHPVQTSATKLRFSKFFLYGPYLS